MKLLVIPTTDWIGHPVPNRLNFIFDRLAKKHEIDVCHFKIFQKKRRDTRCNLIPMDSEPDTKIGSYYLLNLKKHGEKIAEVGEDHDAIVSANIIPTQIANLQDTPVMIDYLDHLPQSAASYYDPPLDKLAERSAKFLTEMNLKKAAGIVTPTNRFKEYLETITDKKIRVVPNGLDLDLIGLTDNKKVEKVRERYKLGHPVLGYVGSLERWIDLEHIIYLMPSLKKRYPKLSLLIVGPGLHTEYAERLKILTQKMGMEKDIVFTGRVDYEELAPYINAMDVGLNPRKPMKMNLFTMGSKVLTYLACGVPVLSKNMPEVENRFKGKGVYKYSSDRDFLCKLVRCFRGSVDPAVVEKYDWDRLSKRYEKVLREIVS